MRRLALLFFLALGWFALPQPAQALGCILLGCDCTVTATDIEFADVNPLSVTTSSADGQVDVQCTGLVSVGAGVVVRLDDGVWGAYAARRMRSSNGDFVDYNIYTPAQPTVVWGDGTGGSQQVQINGGLINIGAWSASRTMHASMTTSAATKPGGYEDTIVVTVIW